MQSVKNTISKLDRYPSTPTFMWNGIKSKKNLIGGIIGLIFIILTLVLVIGKGITVFDRSQIILESFIKKDESSVQMRGLQVSFLLMYYDGDQIGFIPYKYFPIFGIAAILAEVELDYRNKDNPKTNINFYELLPCGDQSLLCVSGFKYNPECSYDNMDFEVCNYVKEYHIIVTNRTSSKPILDGLFPMLMLFDTKYNLFEKNSSDILKKLPIALNKLPNAYGLSLDHRYIYDVPVSKLELTDDQSVMPALFSSPNYTESYFYPSDKLRLVADNQSFFLDRIPTYFDFYLHRSGFTETYKRSFYRIDSMLGQVFGLIGLVSLLFAFLCSGYNEWLMKIHLEESLNSNENNNVDYGRSKSYGAYLKQKFKDIKGKCSSSQPRNTAHLNESETSQLKKQIDIVEMYLKIQKMDKELTELKAQKKRYN